MPVGGRGRIFCTVAATYFGHAQLLDTSRGIGIPNRKIRPDRATRR